MQKYLGFQVLIIFYMTSNIMFAQIVASEDVYLCEQTEVTLEATATGIDVLILVFLVMIFLEELLIWVLTLNFMVMYTISVLFPLIIIYPLILEMLMVILVGILVQLSQIILMLH